MCFHIHEDHPEAKIAEKDIKVFKVLKFKDGKTTSFFMHFDYEPNQSYTQELRVFRNKIEKGFHSFSTLTKAKYDQNSWVQVTLLCEFFIPKGSKYFYNPDKEETVSNQIHWSGRVYRTDRFIPFKGKATRKMLNYNF